MSLITDIAEQLSDVADAIRAKTDGTDGILLADMPGEIAKIEVGDWLSIADRSYTGSLSSETLQAVPTYFFNKCTGLTAVDFPAVTTIGTYAFFGCSSLAEIDFPVASSIGNYAFFSCSSLAEVDFPAATYIGAYAFYNCSSLASADFPMANYIEAQAFNSCTSLTTLIIRTDSVCTLSAISALGSTPIEDGTGYIYVPSDLVEEYQTATNWATYADQIVAIEE